MSSFKRPYIKLYWDEGIKRESIWLNLDHVVSIEPNEDSSYPVSSYVKTVLGDVIIIEGKITP